jgi:hypothetical protein
VPQAGCGLAGYRGSRQMLFGIANLLAAGSARLLRIARCIGRARRPTKDAGQFQPAALEGRGDRPSAKTYLAKAEQRAPMITPARPNGLALW